MSTLLQLQLPINNFFHTETELSLLSHHLGQILQCISA